MSAAHCVRNFSARLKTVLYWLAIVLLTLSLPACSEDKPPRKVDLTNRVSNDLLQQVNVNNEFTFGIGSMITPREGYEYYRQLIRYIGSRLGEEIKIVDRGTYEETNSLLEHRQLDVAFLCGGPYVEGKENFGLELLVLPEVANGPIYHSYLIVPADSPARRLEDLRGKTFAFTDPKSNSGMLVPKYWLAQIGETPDRFFKKQIYTYAHDTSIQAVMDKVVDGAAVDSLIWDFMNSRNPEVGVKTRIIKKSQPFGIPPLVTRPGLPEKTRSQLRDILLNMHQDPEGKAILDNMLIKRFIIGSDSNYDSIRAIRNFVARQQKGKP